METVLASVLIPVYNGSQYVGELLDSIKSQSYKNIQLIIIDDCSKDDSYSVCQKWCNNNNRLIKEVQLVRNESNMGLSENTNRLLLRAQGKYMFLADQDDVWDERKIEVQVDYMEKHPNCMISLSDRSITDENLDIKIVSEFRYLHYTKWSMNFDDFFSHRNVGCSANKMCIRNECKEILTIPNGITEHDRYLASMAVCCGTIDYIFQPLVLYRIHRWNLSGNYSIQSSSGFIECLFRQYRMQRRINGNRKIDNRIIKYNIKELFGIDIDEKKYKMFQENGSTDGAFKSAWKAAVQAKTDGRIGAWK